MTYKLLPPLEKLTPGGRAVGNDADFQQPNFQKVFYGEKDFSKRVKMKDLIEMNMGTEAELAIDLQGNFKT